MKKNFPLIFLIMLASCSVERKDEIELFNASYKNSGSFTIDGKGVFQDSIFFIENPTDTVGPSTLHIFGNWDLSVFNQLNIELINDNETENVNVRLEIRDDTSSNSKGLLTSNHFLFSGQLSNWLVRIPPQLPHPETLQYFSGMRATPYTINGVNSTLQPQKARKLSISLTKNVSGVRLGIRRITAYKGPQVILPEWTQIEKNQILPLIDEYGQFMHKGWQGKTKSDDDLIAARDSEKIELKKYPGADNWCQYGGYKNGETQPATGNFYVKKIHGKWWMVDPDGHLFWSHGVVRVTPSSAITPLDNRKYLFSWLPDQYSSFSEFYKTMDERLFTYYISNSIKETFDFSASNLKRKYGENWREEFNKLIHQRLRSWGMNTISAFSDKSIYLKNRTVYSDFLNLKSTQIDGVPTGLVTISDPFDPQFIKSLKDSLLNRKEELNSEWCFGYCVNNKMSWGNETDLANWVLESSSSQPSKIAFKDFLKGRYNTIDQLNSAWGSNYHDWIQFLTERSKAPRNAEADLKSFTLLLIEKYFSEIKNVFNEVAPRKLYLGCRFNAINKRVLKIAAKYVDAFTFDLFVDSLSNFQLPPGIDKPVLIGEFHFGALDRGLFNAGLNEKANQEQRGEAYYNYACSALQNPLIIGTSWHQYSDQPASGRFDGENYQDGLTDICDKPYPETIDKIREIGYKMYKFRLR